MSAARVLLACGACNALSHRPTLPTTPTQITVGVLTYAPFTPRVVSASRAAIAAITMRSMQFDDFNELATEIRAYLAQLDDSALKDAEAPSPLSYTELNAAGRTDLVKGCMKHGGYVSVSRQLGVRVKPAPPPSTKESQFATRPLENDEIAASLTLAGSAKEDKMVADLARLAARSQQSSTPSAEAGKAEVNSAAEKRLGSPGGSTRLTPIPSRSGQGSSAVGSQSSEGGVWRFLRLDGTQRAGMATLVCMAAAGFGRTSVEVLDADLTTTLQLAFGAVALGHLVIGAYALLLASRATAPAGSSPPFWLVKCMLTGAGGLRELQRELDESERAPTAS